MPLKSGLSPRLVRALVVPAGVAVLALFAGLVDGVNYDLYDRLLRWRAVRRPVEARPYVLVEIDDRSISALGRFPWPRSDFADLLERTTAGGAQMVGMDVLFTETADSAGDERFAEALRKAGNVVLASAPELAPAPRRRFGGDASQGLFLASQVLEPIPLLAQAAHGVGSISIVEDRDGSPRRYPLVVSNQGEAYPSLAQLMTGSSVSASELATLLRGNGTLLINYGALSPAAILRVSFADVLTMDAGEARELFGGRTVFVGTTYTGGVDYGPTPLSPRSPQIFVQIYALHTLLSGTPLVEVPKWVPFLLALAIAGVLSWQIPARHPAQLLAMGLALVAVLLGGSFLIFMTRGVVLGPALPVLATGLIVSGYGLEEWWVSHLNLRKRNKELQETLENLRRTRAAKERMEAELSIAREIQFSMLPMEETPFPDRDDFDLHATLVPAREVGGDFYDYFLVDENHLCVCIADVSDKGVPAALFMAVSKAILKSNAGRDPSPAAILTLANVELIRDNTASMFVSVWMGIVDLTSGEMTYSNAGHNPPYIWTADQNLIRLDASHGPVVAAIDDVAYAEETVVLNPGDVILLYTDGVPEARSPQGELYDEERLRAAVQSGGPGSAREVVERTAADVWQFQGSAPQADDLTMLALRFNGRTAEA